MGLLYVRVDRLTFVRMFYLVEAKERNDQSRKLQRGPGI
jgi:hypothetical protein